MFIQFLGGERRAIMTFMPRLTTDVAFFGPPLLARLATRLDYVARGWFRGISGVLLCLGERACSDATSASNASTRAFSSAQ